MTRPALTDASRSTAPPSTWARVGPLAVWVGALLAILATLVALGSELPSPAPTPEGLHQAVHRDGPLLLALALLRLGALGFVTRELALTAIAATRAARRLSRGATADPRRHPGTQRTRHRLVEQALGRGIAIGLLGTCGPTMVLAAGASPTARAVPADNAPTTAPVEEARVARMVPLAPGPSVPAPRSDPAPAPEPTDGDQPVAVMVVLEATPALAPQPAAELTTSPTPSPPAPDPPPPADIDRAPVPHPAGGSVTLSPHSVEQAPGVSASRSEDTWTVAAGDHLWSIAAETLEDHWGRSAGDEEILVYWASLTEANRSELVDPGDADLLLPGQVLHLPPVPGDVSD